MIIKNGTVFSVLVPLKSSFAPHTARKMIREALLLQGAGDGLADTAELCAAELLNNAYEHSKADSCQVTVRRDDKRAELLIAVADRSRKMPVTTAADDTDEHGRGMAIVAMLAQEHGAYETPTGKTVWFSLPVEPKTMEQAILAGLSDTDLALNRGFCVVDLIREERPCGAKGCVLPADLKSHLQRQEPACYEFCLEHTMLLTGFLVLSDHPVSVSDAAIEYMAEHL